MRRKIFSIWSVLLVLVISISVLVPGCQPTQCTVDVKATLDGSSWSGAVHHALSGPLDIDGSSVPHTASTAYCGSWTCAYSHGGPAGASFVNITPSATQTVSPGGTITFTFNFVTPAAAVLDHFKGYWVEQGASVNVDVELEDQFGSVEATVTAPLYFCNPVEKTHDGEVTEIENPDDHLTVYNLDHEEELQNWVVEVDNQFGEQELNVWGPVMVAVPTQKEGHDYPEGLDHYLLYYAMGPDLNVVVQLEDQFHLEPEVVVLRPLFFANPVQKTHADGDTFLITNPEAHLVFYQIPEELFQTDVSVVNQFGEQTLSLYGSYLLAVPSEKISFEPVEQPLALDHFACYWIGEEWLPVEHGVLSLIDQFVDIEAAELGWPLYFCNPAEKWVWEVLTAPILDPDHHLLFYELLYQEEPGWWQVQVNNQFGNQQLTVWGPVALAVPTQKLVPGDHDPPVGLDHFLLYEVSESVPVQDITVGLNDQFGYEEFALGQPIFFANPVQKTVDGDTILIQNPGAHLVFYEISGQTYSYPPIQVSNQFGGQSYPVVWGPYYLATPSVKLSAGQL